MKIINLSSINIDRNFSVDHIVRPGETIDSSNFDQSIGGKGLNQSIALARISDKVFHTGMINKDDSFIIDYLLKNKVNVDYIKKVSVPTGSAFIQIDKNGENSIILFHGANYKITKTYVDQVLRGFSQGDVIVLQNEISNLSYIIDQARKRGLFIVLNPSPINQGILDLDFNKIDLLLMNQTEACDISGIEEIDSITKYFRSTYKYLRCIISLGKAGAIYFDKKREIFQEAFKVNALDTTGAGDCFAGYFVGLLSKGETVEKSLEYAAAAGGLAVMKKGASASIPTYKEVEKFIKGTSN